MLSVELLHLADVLDSSNLFHNISREARKWSARIHDAIWNTTVRGLSPLSGYNSKECCRSSRIFSHMKLTGSEDVISWTMRMFL